MGRRKTFGLLRDIGLILPYFSHSSVAAQLAASQEGLSSMELVFATFFHWR
jgi:hypothetical protein